MTPYGIALTVVLAACLILMPGSSAEAADQSLLLKAGGYFPATKAFDPGNGIDLAYSYRPLPYIGFEAGTGYYRAESGSTAFISAVPLTVSTYAVLPLGVLNVYGGGGLGGYYKMAGGLDGVLEKSTELPPDLSEFRFGYHANAGIEFSAAYGLSLLIDCKYAVVDQGKFKPYGIKHDGLFLYGAFSVDF